MKLIEILPTGDDLGTIRLRFSEYWDLDGIELDGMELDGMELDGIEVEKQITASVCKVVTRLTFQEALLVQRLLAEELCRQFRELSQGAK